MKKKIPATIVFWLIIILFSTGCSKKEETTDSLYELCMNSIKVEIGEVIMENAVNGTVEIQIEIPDFEKIYLDCTDYEKMEEYMLDTLRKEKYQTLQYTETAIVKVEDGKQIIQTEEIVSRILEEELINAVNVVMEKED